MNLQGILGQLLAEQMVQQQRATQPQMLGLSPNTFTGAFGDFVEADLGRVITSLNLVLGLLQTVGSRRLGNLLILGRGDLDALSQIFRFIANASSELRFIANDRLGFVPTARTPDSPQARFRNVVVQLLNQVGLGPISQIFEQINDRGIAIVPVSTLAGYRNQIAGVIATLNSLVAAA